jgi:hypothetical protein
MGLFSTGPAPGKLKWEGLKGTFQVFRAAVPGGWLLVMLAVTAPTAITFYPDPDHAWDGSSLPSKPE